MNKKINTNLLLLFFFYIVNCGMIAPNQVPKPLKNTTNIHKALKQQEKGRTLKLKQKKIRKAKRQTRRITNAVDSGALLIAIGAVIVMSIGVYYFFSLGFFTGVLALIAAAFLLYLLFQYLEY